MMNDYRKRMSSTGLSSYARASILVYDSLESQLDDSEPTITVHSQYLPGFLSIQRSIDRYLINQKQNITLTASQVRSRVLESFSLTSTVGVGD